MKRLLKHGGLLWLSLAALLAMPATILAQSQDEPDVVHCETVDEITQARQNGAIYIETGGRYFVRIGNDYEGPFVRLATAVELRRRFEANRSSGAVIQQGTAAAANSGIINPELMLFPFIEPSPEGVTLMRLPGDEVVPASKVMLHPQPYAFDSVSFGVIDLNPQRLQALRQGTAPQRNPAAAPSKPYFAISGLLAPDENIEPLPVEMPRWVGAAVVGNDGVVLWNQFGEVNENNRFRVIAPRPETRLLPQFLLIFALAEGELATNLRPDERFPQIDASGYTHHVLAASALEMGPNWFPPLEKTTREEYQKLLKQERQKTLPSPNQ